jgi:hypothetical protein
MLSEGGRIYGSNPVPVIITLKALAKRGETIYGNSGVNFLYCGPHSASITEIEELVKTRG